MEDNILQLLPFRGNKSSLFTGRTQGEQARTALNLDKLDSEEGSIKLLIPAGTTSFNPSFYLGLLYASIKGLGIKRFKEKYQLLILDNNPKIVDVLEANLKDGERYALNTIEDKTGFNRFFNFGKK